MHKMIDPDMALRLVVDATERLDPVEVELGRSVGWVLAQQVAADRDYPPFDRAMMDGYAVRLSAAGAAVAVIGELAAGGVWERPLTDGQALEIMTGAPCPEGTEAVAPKEVVERQGETVRLPESLKQGQNIAPRAGACPAGRPLIDQGEPITPLTVGVLATVGRARVMVYPRPRVGIVSTGGELIGVDETPGPGQIRNSNGPMIAAYARAMGLEAPRVVEAADTPESLATALERVAAAEIVVLNGGVSAGKYDLVPQALTDFGAELVFHKVTQKPGKPLLFARRGRQLFFGLPGNPLSVSFGFHRYVAAAIRKMSGRRPQPEGGKGRLTDGFRVKGDRTVFQPARVEAGAMGWRVAFQRNVDSADIFNTHHANAMVRLDPPVGEYVAGMEVGFEWMSF